MHIVDTLNRANLPDNGVKSKFFSSLENVPYKDTLMVRGSRLREFKQHAAEDENLQEISRLILCGWPDFRQETPYAARTYFNYRDELHTQDGQIFKGNHLVAPKTLRMETLDIAHQGHIELEGCQRWMREALLGQVWHQI